MPRPFVTSAAVGLALLGFGGAQAAPVTAGAAPPGLSAHAPAVRRGPVQLRERRRLKPGMVVLDGHGARVGLIVQVQRVKNGRPAVLLDVNGAQFKVQTRTLKLSPDGEEAITSLSPSQLRTSAILNTY